MSKYGYRKYDAGDAGQFSVTVTTPDGVTGDMLFTRTEGAAAAIAWILAADQGHAAPVREPLRVGDLTTAAEIHARDMGDPEYRAEWERLEAGGL